VDPKRARQLEHLEQLLLRRPELQRPADVLADARYEQVRRGRIDRQADEFLDLRVERGRALRHSGELGERLEEDGVGVAQGLPPAGHAGSSQRAISV
jgi:hypothetical protein